MHSTIEEEIFYPELEDFPEVKDMIREAYKYHLNLDHLLAQLGTMAPSEDGFHDLLAELRDNFDYHVESEGFELFSEAEKLCDESRPAEMGQQMDEIKTIIVRARPL